MYDRYIYIDCYNVTNFRENSEWLKGVVNLSVAYIGIDKKQEARLQFLEEIRKQVEGGENKEDRWKRTIL